MQPISRRAALARHRRRDLTGVLGEVLASHKWAYRCTVAGVPLPQTRDMLAKHSFCWRSVFTKAQATTSGSPPFIPNVQGIHVGDSLHIYFAAKNAPDVLVHVQRCGVRRGSELTPAA